LRIEETWLTAVSRAVQRDIEGWGQFVKSMKQTICIARSGLHYYKTHTVICRASHRTQLTIGINRREHEIRTAICSYQRYACLSAKDKPGIEMANLA
jgi:hypothetical protein